MAASRVSDSKTVELQSRDKRTLELRRHYDLPHSKDELRGYETRVWFYFPQGFGISAQTWTPDNFYRDVNVFMRVNTPGLSLKDLADLNHPHNAAGILRQQLPRLIEPDTPTAVALDTLAKILGAELADAVTRATRELIKQLKSADAYTDLSSLTAQVKAVCADTLRALGATRRLRAKARAYRTVAAPTLLPSLALAEEYASAVVDERFAELARAIDDSPGLRDGKGTATIMRLATANAALAVHTRRREQGFPTPTLQTSDRATVRADEHFTYRLSLLKKDMQRALYVDARHDSSDPFFRNSAAMVAAGLAATWATLAQVPLLTGGLSGSSSALLLAAAVGAYILKDRIKEWTRAMLTRKLLPWDHDDHIVGDALACAGLGSLRGRASEQVRWVKDDAIPVVVDELRKRQRTVRGISDLEHVLSYRRRVVFNGDEDPVPDGFGVQELVRLSLDDVIKRLDDPVDEISYYDPTTGAFERQGMPKVYHLNIVVETVQLTGKVESENRLSRFRVVCNQEGVVRIDTVADAVPIKKESAAEQLLDTQAQAGAE